jgi:hypothetical protein
MPDNYYTYLSVSVTGLTVYFVLRYIWSAIEDYRFAKSHGCKPAFQIPQNERILGIQNVLEQVALSKAKRSFPEALARFRRIGNTFTLVAMGRKVVVTIEPQNVKTILATNFNDYGLGRRITAMGPLLGTGIFTSDGADWQHSRVRTYDRNMIPKLTCSGTCTSQLYQR